MTDTPTSLAPPAQPLPQETALHRLVGADSLTRLKRLLPSAPDRVTPPEQDRATRPRRGRQAHIVRMRCLAFGGLLAMAAAVAIIISSSLGGSPPVTKAAVKVTGGRPRYWIVRPGQTLVSIAARESVDPTLVQRANPSLIATRLVPGQRVRLP